MANDEQNATVTFEARHAAHTELLSLRAGLIAEFSDRVPPSIIQRVIEHAREQLLASGTRAGLPHAVELRARARLSGRSPAFRLTR